MSNKIVLVRNLDEDLTCQMYLCLQFIAFEVRRSLYYLYSLRDQVRNPVFRATFLRRHVDNIDLMRIEVEKEYQKNKNACNEGNVSENIRRNIETLKSIQELLAVDYCSSTSYFKKVLHEVLAVVQGYSCDDEEIIKYAETQMRCEWFPLIFEEYEIRE